MRQFLLPDLGEGLDEAEIVAWHVTEAITSSPTSRWYRLRPTRRW
jgi:hypothetical protein